MHGLEHIRDAYRKFRALAESRENWRQTRTKLALCNPGLVLTMYACRPCSVLSCMRASTGGHQQLCSACSGSDKVVRACLCEFASSTKAMMQDGKCICGWCGSKDHITGDVSCAAMAASKKKQADKQKNRKHKATRAREMGVKAQAVKNTLAFVHNVDEARHQDEKVEHATVLVAHRPPTSGSGRRTSLQLAAKRVISNLVSTPPMSASNQEESSYRTSSRSTGPTTEPAAALSPAVPPIVLQRARQDDSVEHPPAAGRHLLSSPISSARSLTPSHIVLTPPAAVAPRKAAIADAKALESASNKLYAYELQHLTHPDTPATAAVKLEEVRKCVFPEQVASQYRETLVRKVKRLSTMQDYVAVRTEVLETMRAFETAPGAEERAHVSERSQLRKPAIPKPVRCLCTKGKAPRPDRFNRKINRMLRRLRLKEHPLLVVEESLQDV